MPHDFLSSFTVKSAEYLVAVTFLVSFPLFWKFLHGGKAAQPVRARAPERHEGDFLMPDGFFFHPGQVWARLAGASAVVGMTDFAQKLVGAIGQVELPAVGARVGQGEKALRLRVGDRLLDMVSPVDGTVVEVNLRAAGSPQTIQADPYGEGWLFKVAPERPEANLRNLLSGERARQWMAQVWEDLRSRVSPELGLVAQDGGAPVDGIAQNIDPEKWDTLARSYFLT